VAISFVFGPIGTQLLQSVLRTCTQQQPDFVVVFPVVGGFIFGTGDMGDRSFGI
jgi:hypothetical protein